MKPSENDLIRRVSRIAPGRATKGQIRLGMGDDAALFAPRRGYEIVLTCDWSLEGTHFLRDTHPPDSIGWKCLARAVSDLAAMGAEPKCFLFSLALPLSHTGTWLDRFLHGLRRASRKFVCSLVGGDTTRNPEILINVTAVGEVRAGQAIRRSGAKNGDLIYVSGRLGQAELGLRLLRKGKQRVSRDVSSLRKHLYPLPRLALGVWLAEQGLATAMMDLSDGLSTDLGRLCSASGVGANVEVARIPAVQPVSANAKDLDLLGLALHGGDDYELVFTVSKRRARRLPRFFRGIPLTRVGEITRGRRVELALPHGRKHPLRPGGWDPFRR